MSQIDTQKQPFNPNEHVTQIKTKNGMQDYLPVQWRLVWFREQCPQGIIMTKSILLDPEMETEEEGFVWNEEKRKSEKIIKRAKGFAVFHAHIEDGKGGRAEGTKSEKAASFPDYIEKAETGAIGRALAALGYGTQFAPELDEEHRIVDSPVANGTGETRHVEMATPAMTTSASPKPAQPARKATDKALDLAKTNREKVNALLAEYQALCPDKCTAQNWVWKVLREALQIREGPLPANDAYTPEHILALAQFVAPHRKQDVAHV